jgi:hypothetical protein
MLEKREGLVHFCQIDENGRDYLRPGTLSKGIGFQNLNDEPFGSRR